MIQLTIRAFAAADPDGSVYLYENYPRWNKVLNKWSESPMAYLGKIGEDDDEIPGELKNLTVITSPRICEIFIRTNSLTQIEANDRYGTYTTGCCD